MEGSDDGAVAGNNCFTSSHEQYSSAENTVEQLTLQPAVSDVEGSSVLADTLNQLLHTPMDIGQNMNILDDPSCLMQSTLDVDKSLLASFDSGATVGTNLSTTEQMEPAVGKQETASAPIPSSGEDCNSENAFFVPSNTSASELTDLNVSQLASSIIDSAAMSASINPLEGGAYARDSGSGFVGIDSELGMSGSIIDQISPPMELPDLNLVMAEGMATANEEKTMVSQQLALSEVSTPMVVAPPQTSTITSEQNLTSTPTIPLVSDAQSTSASHQYTLPPTPIPTHTDSTESVLFSSSSPSTDQVHVGTLTAPVPSTIGTQTPPSAMLPSSSVTLSTPATVPTILPSASTAHLKMTSALSSTDSPLTTFSQSSVASTSGFPPPSAVTPVSSSAATASLSTTSSAPSLPSGPSTSQSATAAASTFAKGLNLPLLQFLHLNFPSLKIKDLQEVLNINTLLTQVLKQQLNQVDSIVATQQQATQAKASQQVTIPRVVAPKPSVAASGTVPVQLTTSSLSKTLDTSSLQPKSNVLTSTSTSNVLSATSRSATQTGLFVPSSPLGALTKPQAPSSQIASVGTSSSLANVFSEVKAMPARPVRADGQPVLSQPQTGSSLGINVDQLSRQNPSLVSSLSSPSNSAPSSLSSSPNTNSRKAVLVQILNKSNADPLLVNSSSLSSTPLTTSVTSTRNPILVPRTTPLSKSPLILNRHSRIQQTQVPRLSTPPLHGLLSDQSTPTSLVTKSGTPVSSLCVSLSLPALKNLPDSRRKRKVPLNLSGSSLDQQLHRTVVQPAESEAMEVDVGQPIQRLELPKHLKDHSYCIYNPEEGERQLSNIDRSSFSSIPPARLSYAPQVPDSPSTLHKLLKVLPKKNTRQSLAITPPPHSSSSRNHSGRTNKGRGSRKSNNRGVKMRGKGMGKKVGGTSPGLPAGSEDESRGSSSELSDTDEPSEKVRKFYILHYTVHYTLYLEHMCS